MAFNDIEIGMFIQNETRREDKFAFGCDIIRRAPTLEEIDGDFDNLLENTMEELLCRGKY